MTKCRCPQHIHKCAHGVVVRRGKGEDCPVHPAPWASTSGLVVSTVGSVDVDKTAVVTVVDVDKREITVGPKPGRPS